MHLSLAQEMKSFLSQTPALPDDDAAINSSMNTSLHFKNKMSCISSWFVVGWVGKVDGNGRLLADNFVFFRLNVSVQYSSFSC